MPVQFATVYTTTFGSTIHYTYYKYKTNEIQVGGTLPLVTFKRKKTKGSDEFSKKFFAMDFFFV